MFILTALIKGDNVHLLPPANSQTLLSGLALLQVAFLDSKNCRCKSTSMDDKHRSPDINHVVETATDELPVSGSTASVGAGENNEHPNSCEELSTFQLVLILAGLWVS